MSQLNKTQLEQVNQTNFPNNTVQFITPEKLREIASDEHSTSSERIFIQPPCLV